MSKRSLSIRDRRIPLTGIVLVHLGVLLVFVVAAVAMSKRGEARFRQLVTGVALSPRVPISHRAPHQIEPLYDDPDIVSDEELIAVLAKIRPRFASSHLAPNYVEHALRTWGRQIDFDDPELMDGPDMVRYLTDYAAHLASFHGEGVPLLLERPGGFAINWGRQPGESVHHDHTLACLSEAGCPLNTPVFGPTRRGTLNDMLQQALRDFDPSGQEIAWSALAFGLWLPPDHNSWTNGDGRRIDFNLLAEALMRGALRFGVCGGTHRLYSLMVLLRLDEEFDVLDDTTHQAVFQHLRDVRDRIVVTQYPDGHWGTDWPDAGIQGEGLPEEPHYRKVIATGHLVEWLAIAPPELQPPRSQVEHAADWLIETVQQTSTEQILSQYTFFTHVGNALALWRGTHPAQAWRRRNQLPSEIEPPPSPAPPKPETP